MKSMKTFWLFLTAALFAMFIGVTAFAQDAHDHQDEHENHEGHDEHDETEQHEEDHEEHDDHGHGEEDSHEHEEENTSRIDDDMAKQVGIVTAFASPQQLHQTISVYGSLASGPEQVSHVRARFEGLVKSVNVTIGDYVKTGDVLADVESNESLKSYKIRAPISGRIVERHANTGEATQNQRLFSIANFETLWAELKIYPAQQLSVKEGQSVNIVSSNNVGFEAEVSHIIPSLNAPYQLARVEFENSVHNLSPGLLVEARIETNSFPVSLAVLKDAVQSLGGRQGVFLKQDDEYVFKPLLLGQQDDHFYEVLDGIESGDEYVSENSYLIKADIEKSEAEHEH
ncbi:hypothetical protein NBRC116493_35310 [Aurantivibrio infirmus]